MRNDNQALVDTDAALKLLSRDAVIHEFRALVLFAMGDYKTAAAALNSLLSVGPGWDCKTMRSLHAENAEYTNQLRALGKHSIENPKSARARFVLGYHYLTCGHKDAAVKQFKEAVALAPSNAVSKQLLGMLGQGESSGADLPPKPGDPGEKPDAKPAMAMEDLQGTWSAKRGNDMFQLTLSADKRFIWAFTSGGKKTEIKGVYALDGNTLAMEPDAGGVMVGQIAMKDNTLQFKMVGGDEKDPGLSFTK